MIFISFPSRVAKNLLVNRLSFEEIHANLTLNAQVKGQINTNSWRGYHEVDNLPLNFIGYSSLYKIFSELNVNTFNQKARKDIKHLPVKTM